MNRKGIILVLFLVLTGISLAAQTRSEAVDKQDSSTQVVLVQDFERWSVTHPLDFQAIRERRDSLKRVLTLDSLQQRLEMAIKLAFKEALAWVSGDGYQSCDIQLLDLLQGYQSLFGESDRVFYPKYFDRLEEVMSSIGRDRTDRGRPHRIMDGW